MSNDFTYTVLLMHMNGANNSTTFTDEQGSSVVPHGDAKISTAQSKFGGASAYFDGNGDYLTVPDCPAFDLTGGVDFTIETYCFLTALTGGDMVLVCKDGKGGVAISQYELIVSGAGKLKALLGDGIDVQTTQIFTGGTTISLNVWHHLAISKNGTLVKLFLDGGQEDSQTLTATMRSGGRSLYIGWQEAQGNIQYMNGYLDEIRITKGFSRYNAPFTPPAAAFETDAYGHKASGLILPRHNPDFNGPGTLTGYTRVQTGPSTYTALGNCVVALFDAKTKRIVAQTVSDNAGVYTFTDLNPARSYYANAFDPTGTYDVTATNNLQVN